MQASGKLKYKRRNRRILLKHRVTNSRSFSRSFLFIKRYYVTEEEEEEEEKVHWIFSSMRFSFNAKRFTLNELACRDKKEFLFIVLVTKTCFDQRIIMNIFLLKFLVKYHLKKTKGRPFLSSEFCGLLVVYRMLITLVMYCCTKIS